MNSVIPKAAAEHAQLFNEPALGGFVKQLSLTYVAQQSETKIISLNLVTPKA